MAAHALKMRHGMGCKAILIDLSKDGELFVDYLKQRNPKTESQVRK